MPGTVGRRLTTTPAFIDALRALPIGGHLVRDRLARYQRALLTAVAYVLGYRYQVERLTTGRFKITRVQ